MTTMQRGWKTTIKDKARDNNTGYKWSN